jgi:hypothetical protein
MTVSKTPGVLPMGGVTPANMPRVTASLQAFMEDMDAAHAEDTEPGVHCTANPMVPLGCGNT